MQDVSNLKGEEKECWANEVCVSSWLLGGQPPELVLNLDLRSLAAQ